MEEWILSPAAICSPLFAEDMDFDCINELLGDECWLETVHGADFLPQCSSHSTNALSSPSVWSPSDTFTFENIFGQTQEESNHEPCVTSSLPGDTSLIEIQSGAAAKNQKTELELVSSARCSGKPGYQIDVMDTTMNFWVGPRSTAVPEISVIERLVRAIGFIKDSTKDREVLIQIWGPKDLNGRRVLTTIDQPYLVDSSSTSLANYRSISLNFQFSADNNSNIVVGMPGRVFLGKVPEWTPDVRFFRFDEYARVGYAQALNVRGTLALPFFERGSQTCLGVIEVVTTTERVKAELDSVCEALQAVDLSSNGSQPTEKVKVCKQSYHAALPDILEVMRSACLTHNLPLAQTWMRCFQQGKEGCRHSKENYMHCVSTVDSACYVSDSSIRGFHEACSEHHLLLGQGVAGKAFMTNEPCFYDDITSLCKTDYPLSHHARMFGLHAAVAIRLRSVHTGIMDIVLEFFLPAYCREPEEQKKMLSLLSLIIHKTCKGLRVVTDDELGKDYITSVSTSVVPQKDCSETPKMICNSQLCVSITHQSPHVATSIQKEELSELMHEESTVIQSSSRGSTFEDGITFGEENFGNISREADKKRTKAEDAITLEVLQRHFGGSLKEAAKSLSVCPATLKRICRKQGVKRWPSRKIKKVGHSLEKLQSVIDLEQDPPATIQIGSFYSSFSELASPSSKFEITHQSSVSELNMPPKSVNVHHEVNADCPPTKSVSLISSCSQTSSSSYSCCSGSNHRSSSWNYTRSEDAATIGKNSNDVVLQKIGSEATLNWVGYEDSKLLSISQSQVILAGIHNSERLPLSRKDARKEMDGMRVKVTYGDDKIRIRMQHHWQFNDLKQEIRRRFHVDASSEVQLKYLDDDCDWVLLTCNADLEECVDVWLSSSSNTIKLSLCTPPIIMEVCSSAVAESTKILKKLDC